MWPFRKKQSEPEGYEARMLDALEAQASGAIDRKLITGYIQGAASAWAEAFALATVSASEAVRRALSPIILASAGRDLILHGGSFHRVGMMDGAVHLQRPLSAYRLAVTGWQLAIGDPSRPSTINVLDSEVLFMPWQTDAANPYCPIAPWRNATGQLGREMESVLLAETGGPMGMLLFLQNPLPYSDADAKNASLDRVQQSLDFSGQKRGKLALLKSPAEDRAKGFTQDSQGRPFRVGPNPPQAIAELRSQMGAEILASCSCRRGC